MCLSAHGIETVTGSDETRAEEVSRSVGAAGGEPLQNALAEWRVASWAVERSGLPVTASIASLAPVTEPFVVRHELRAS